MRNQFRRLGKPPHRRAVATHPRACSVACPCRSCGHIPCGVNANVFLQRDTDRSSYDGGRRVVAKSICRFLAKTKSFDSSVAFRVIDTPLHPHLMMIAKTCSPSVAVFGTRRKKTSMSRGGSHHPSSSFVARSDQARTCGCFIVLNRIGGTIDLDNLADRVIKRSSKQTAWNGRVGTRIYQNCAMQWRRRRCVFLEEKIACTGLVQ